MRSLSIRVRLTLWYFAVLAASLILFAGGVYLAVRESIFTAVDEDLRAELEGIRRLLAEELPGESLSQVLGELEEYSQSGLPAALVQVSNSEGRWVYQSAAVRKYNLPNVSPADIKDKYHYASLGSGERLLRVASAKIMIGGETHVLRVAVRLEEFGEALEVLRWILLTAIPGVLLLALAGGYWTSRSALAPVDRITRTARSISEHNLSQRLEESPTGDELQRLSQTLNEMLARLESAFRRNTQFMADASHELRTPLALMRTTAELALRRDRVVAEYRGALEQILRELDRSSRLIEDMLTLARADSGTAALSTEPLDLVASLRDASGHLERLCREKQVELHEVIPPEQCQVQGDAGALHRLFLILLDNALKYTGAGGRIAIRLRQGDGVAIVEVTDTGIGISEQDLPHIFERFYRSDKARSRDSGGAGLGLSIARWIVEAHHGRIQVQSSLGHGSTFRVDLPLATEPLD